MHLFKVTVLNLHVIMRKPKVNLIMGMSGRSIISIISTNLGPFGANSVIIFGVSISIRWYTSIFQTLQARSHNEANEAVASPKISKKNLPQMKNS